MRHVRYVLLYVSHMKGFRQMNAIGVREEVGIHSVHSAQGAPIDRLRARFGLSSNPVPAPCAPVPVVLPAAAVQENSPEYAEAKQIVAVTRAELATIERERYRGRFPRAIANMVALCLGCIEEDEPQTPTVPAYLPHFRELAEAGKDPLVRIKEHCQCAIQFATQTEPWRLRGREENRL